MTCASPIALERLLAYWLGEEREEDQGTIEEHLLACAQCSQRLEWLAALASAVRTAVQQGRVDVVVSEPFVRAMKQAGLRLREYRLEPGGSVNCTIRPDDDAVVSRIRAPLSGVKRLDVVRIQGGEAEARIDDVPFDAETGELLMIPSAAWLRTMPAFTMRLRLIAVGEAGESELGEYTFLHSPS